MNTSLLSIATSDERLWRAVESGDTTAFQTVVERYQGAVSGVAFNIVGDFAASQDVSQETFWTAWKSRSQLRDPQRLGAWLCGIARNLASKWRKQHGKQIAVHSPEITLVSTEGDPALSSISAEEQALVWNSLEELPENYRDVLVLYYRQSHSIADVAVALDLSEEAVKQRLSRGREMMRQQLATVIEDVLVRTRPGKNFTAKVMTGLIGFAAAMKTGGTVSAASLTGKAAGGATSGVAAAATKAALTTGAGAGVVGGFIGAAGGLGGAWLGTWLPAQLAPTMTERKLLETQGHRLFVVSLIYTLFLLALTPLLFVPGGLLWYFVTLGVATLVFVFFTIVVAVKTQKLANEIRKSIRPDDDPNPSTVKARLESWNITGQPAWKGHSFTSQIKLLSIPLIDIQFNGNADCAAGMKWQPKTANGWIAIGDRARGLLIGVGGIARGLFAIGGMAWGGVAIGGLSLGLISLGGLAAGALALGGCSIGHTAIGGCAAGWTAAGGFALGWHSAAGGLAIAYHAAMGGLAIANEFAVGGTAIAAETNTPAAQQIIERDTLKWLLDWFVQHRILVTAIMVGMSLVPSLVWRLISWRR